MKKFLLLAVATVSLGACSTVAGVGEDITSASRSVQQAL